MEKRAYKLQEFVAHSSNVNCLSIGKKIGKVFITGGDDHKVNLWAVGKSTCLLSLSGHTSSVETVVFDSAEVLVLSGASSGAIKLWDLEEGKIVRNLTGHRLNCTAVEFHPFGEFFASGSSDANLKIWDIRKKGCLHTYTGHTQGVSTIKFSPDGRWVVSGGADNVVKIWDLTAGKLLQEFKYHVGQIRSIEFHPMEFLLATGSADRTVNFWDLETFELIGSAGPEASGLRSMTFHPDGRTLFCGLDDKLKIFSWEPIKCHDVVDMGWSTLDDLSIHDAKLLACSHHRNCVDVWVADISLIEPHRVGGAPLSFDTKEQKFKVQEGIVKPSTEKHTSPRAYEATEYRNIYPRAYEATEYRNIYVDTADSRKISPKRIDLDNDPKVVHMLNPSDNYNISSPTKNLGPEPRERNSSHAKSRSFTPPVVVPRNTAVSTVRPRREANSTERGSPGIRREPTLTRRPSSRKSDSKLSMAAEPGIVSSKKSGSDISEEPKFHFRFLSINEPTKTSEENSISSTVAEKVERTLSPDVPMSSNCVQVQNSNGETSSTKILRGVAVQLGRTRSLVQRWESRDKCNNSEDQTNSALPEDLTSTLEHKGPLPQREESSVPGKEMEALDLLEKEREALSLIEKEREASTLLKKERETWALLKKEREALALLKKERELAFLKKEREALASLEKEKEALALLEKEREAFALLEKEREALAVIVKEKEASRLIEREREAVSRIEKEREASRRIENEREASRLIERKWEASRINEKERETSRSIEKEREASCRNNEDAIDGIMQDHYTFLSDLRSRLTKLQVVRHFWLRNDVKGGIHAVGKLPDHCIQADVAAVLVGKMEIITLDLFTCLLPLFTSLLNSDIDRHTNVSLEMLLKLVAIFGPVIRSTMSSSPSVRVDLQAERRRGFCKQCSIHLKKIKQLLPSVTRRGGSLAKGARELNLVLQEF